MMFGVLGGVTSPDKRSEMQDAFPTLGAGLHWYWASALRIVVKVNSDIVAPWTRALSYVARQNTRQRTLSDRGCISNCYSLDPNPLVIQISDANSPIPGLA
jgi:hypothetical protein